MTRISLGMLCAALFMTPVEAAPLDVFKDCDVCPEMVELPMGEFLMGAPEGESRQNHHWYDNGWRPVTPENPYIAYQEGPVHRVEIDMPIAMGRNEVTYDQWMTCVNEGRCESGTMSATSCMTRTRNREIMRQSKPPHDRYAVAIFGNAGRCTVAEFAEQLPR